MKFSSGTFSLGSNVEASGNGRVRIAATTHTGTALRTVSRAWQWLLSKNQQRRESRRLRLVETVALGEKRFVALIEIDGAQFLIGGGASSVALLASMSAPPVAASEPVNGPQSATVQQAEPDASSFEKLFAAQLRSREIEDASLSELAAVPKMHGTRDVAEAALPAMYERAQV